MPPPRDANPADGADAPPSAAARAGTVDQLVSQHLAAWNEPRPAVRARHLAATWSELGHYASPVVEIHGRAALDAHIAECQVCDAGLRYVVTGEVAHHGRHLHVAWALESPDGVRLIEGRSVAELDADGRIARLVAFFEPKAPAAGV